MEQDKAIAWLEEQRAVCRGCGHHLDETHATHSGEWEAVVERCAACEAKELRIAAMREDGGNVAGLKVHVERRR